MEKYELAYQDYKAGMKYKDIAAKYEVSLNTVKSWKSRKWNALEKEGAPKIQKGVHTKTEKVAHKERVQPVIENDDLTEQQKMFCLFYLQHFNGTKAYQQAYGCSYKTANTNATRLLVKESVKAELHRLKAELQQDTFVTTKDLVAEYVRQAFADIADFVEFGSVEFPYTDRNDEEIVDEETGEVKTYKVSHVSLKGSDEVDGALIQEVKKGKDGVSVKLYDKQRAMSELMKYLGGDELRNAQIKKLGAEGSSENSEDWRQAVMDAANRRKAVELDD